jgi:hypothetical protein
MIRNSRHDAVRVMDSLAAAGVRFIKFHADGAPRELFFTILREARRVGLPVVGHVSVHVTSVEAADSGMRSIEHAYSSHPCFPRTLYFVLDTATIDTVATEERCAPAVAAYLRNGTWVTPTAVLFALSSFPRGRPQVQSFLRTTRRLGFDRFLAGSDATPDGWYGPPGSLLLEELVILAKSGLTPLEALQTATLNPAKFLGATDSLGSVAPGKLADLVLLDANPLADIRHVTRIHGVVANGRYFDRVTLDTLDPGRLSPERMKRADSFAELPPLPSQPSPRRPTRASP